MCLFFNWDINNQDTLFCRSIFLYTKMKIEYSASFFRPTKCEHLNHWAVFFHPKPKKKPAKSEIPLNPRSPVSHQTGGGKFLPPQNRHPIVKSVEKSRPPCKICAWVKKTLLQLRRCKREVFLTSGYGWSFRWWLFWSVFFRFKVVVWRWFFFFAPNVKTNSPSRVRQPSKSEKRMLCHSNVANWSFDHSVTIWLLRTEFECIKCISVIETSKKMLPMWPHLSLTRQMHLQSSVITSHTLRLRLERKKHVTSAELTIGHRSWCVAFMSLFGQSTFLCSSRFCCALQRDCWGDMGLWRSIGRFLSGMASQAANQLTQGFVGTLLGWHKVEKQVQAPKVVQPEANRQVVVISPHVAETNEILRKIVEKMPQPEAPAPPLPFQVIEASNANKINPCAFEHLVGMQNQHYMLEALSSMTWTHWREAESKIRRDRRQRVAFLIFSGGPGSGKTAHAKALGEFFGIPSVLLSPGSATFVNTHGRSTMRQVIDYAVKCKSAVILLDEIDVYVKDEGFMAEVRQLVDGASQIDDDAIMFVIGTTNKDLSIFPEDLLQRVILHVPFDGKRLNGAKDLSCFPQRHSSGFNLKECKAFWDRNAICLKHSARQYLACSSLGFSPRDLQLWVQKVLIATCRKAMENGQTAETMALPTWWDFMEAGPRKEQAELSVHFHSLPETLEKRILECTTFLPILASSESNTYMAYTASDDDKPLIVHTCFKGGKEVIDPVENPDLTRARL